MSRFKKAIDQSYFDKEAMYERIIEKQTKPAWFRSRPLQSLAFALVLILVLTQVPQKQSSLIGIQTPQNKLAYAVVSVDINPSFELYTDQKDTVIDVKALNAEAKTINTQSWIGQIVSVVIDDLILQSTQLGYLNPRDTQTDYIVVSTVSYGADGQAITKTIQTQLTQNTELNRTVKTYVLNGKPEDYEEAEKENVSVGIYLMNGVIQNQGSPMTIKEFTQDPANLDRLEEISEHQDTTDLVPIVQALIDDLKTQGIDVSSYQTQMDQSNVDLEELIDDIKDEYHQEDKHSEDKDHQDGNDSEENDEDD